VATGGVTTGGFTTGGFTTGGFTAGGFTAGGFAGGFVIGGFRSGDPFPGGLAPAVFTFTFSSLLQAEKLNTKMANGSSLSDFTFPPS
jgi:hypothetical protein